MYSPNILFIIWIGLLNKERSHLFSADLINLVLLDTSSKKKDVD